MEKVQNIILWMVCTGVEIFQCLRWNGKEMRFSIFRRFFFFSALAYIVYIGQYKMYIWMDGTHTHTHRGHGDICRIYAFIWKIFVFILHFYEWIKIKWIGQGAGRWRGGPFLIILSSVHMFFLVFVLLVVPIFLCSFVCRRIVYFTSVFFFFCGTN